MQLRCGFGKVVEIEADKERIYQVISNLINNAIKSIDDATEIDERRTDEIIISVKFVNDYQNTTCFEYQVEYDDRSNNSNQNDERDKNSYSICLVQ